MSTKVYKIRFYSGRVTGTKNPGKVSDVFKDIAADGSSGPVATIRGRQMQIRGLTSLNNGSVYKGALVKFRDDAPFIGDLLGSERPIDLGSNEHVLEKNFFLFHRTHQILDYQINAEGLHPASFASYLSEVAGNNKIIWFDDIVRPDALQRLQNGVIKKIEISVTQPKNSNSIKPNDWSSKAFDWMSGSGATRMNVTLSTRGAGNHLKEEVKSKISSLLKQETTKGVKVRLQGDENPIDLFADCITGAAEVNMDGRYPIPDSIYSGLNTAHTHAKSELDAYFALGDAALD